MRFETYRKTTRVPVPPNSGFLCTNFLRGVYDVIGIDESLVRPVLPTQWANVQRLALSVSFFQVRRQTNGKQGSDCLRQHVLAL